MSHKNSHQLTSAGDLADLCHRCREPAVHSIIFCLPCSIGIHLEKRLRPYLPAVIVIPTSINHTTVIQQSRSDSVHLIETEYLTAKRLGAGLGVRRNIKRFYVELYARYEHGFDLQYVAQPNRVRATVSAGYNF